MNQTLKIFCLSTILSVSSNIIASEMNEKTSVYIQLSSDEIVSKIQKKNFKNMDLVGINPYTHQAEIYVTKDELEFLKSRNLEIVFKQKNTTFVDLSQYLNPEQVREKLRQINKNFPNLTYLSEIGRTHENLPIMALEISENPGDATKPVIMFNGMNHAREVMSAEVVMHSATTLTEQYEQDSEIRDWLKNYRIFVVPQVNPDGNERVHNGYNMWRKNAYKSSGRIVGVDLNRNYPALWNRCNGSSSWTFSETYRGPSAGSEPETQAMINFSKKIKPVATISYHTYSEMIMYPYACSNMNNPSKDVFVQIAKNIRAGIRDDQNRLNTYKVGTAPELLYDADGGDDDHYWEEDGAMAFTIEVNASSFQPDYNTWRNVTVERQEGGWKNLIRQMKKSGFHGVVKTSDPSLVKYSIKKLSFDKWIAFDADNSNKKFSLRSEEGLLFQMTAPGKYQIQFYKNDDPVKVVSVEVGDQNIDLGTVDLT